MYTGQKRGNLDVGVLALADVGEDGFGLGFGEGFILEEVIENLFHVREEWK
jgi:hypothetical protein